MARDGTPTLNIRLSPSRNLFAALASIHLGSVACLLASDLPAMLAWPAAVAVLLLAARCIREHAAASAGRAIVHLAWDRGGRWRLIQRDGRVVDARLDQGTYVHPLLVALALRDADGRTRRVMVVSDRIDAQDFRRLRVRLRCEGAVPGGDVQRAPLC